MRRRTVLFGVLAVALLFPAAASWLALRPVTGSATAPGTVANLRGAPFATSGAAPSIDSAGASDASRGGRRTRHRGSDGAGTVVGRLLRRGSELPLAGVTVILTPGRGGPRTSLVERSDDDGRFAFSGVPAFDAWALSAPGRASPTDAHAVRVEVRADTETDVGIVYVDGGETVEGVVVTEQGEPIAGALVRAVARGPGTTGADLQQAVRGLPDEPPTADSAVTSEDGTFVLTRVPSGTCDVIGSAPDRATVVVRDVMVATGRGGQRVRLVLPPGVSLDGRVVHRLGGEVSGLHITAFAEHSTENDLLLLDRVRALTDTEGRFRLDGLARLESGQRHMVCVTQRNGVRTLRERVDIDRARTVEIAIGGETMLEGTITDQGCKPVEGAEIMLHLDPDENHSRLFAIALSDADGRYVLTDLPTAEVEGWVVTADGFSAFPDHSSALIRQKAATQLKLAAGRNVHDVRLDGASRVRGVVLERGTGEPLSGVRVRLLSSRSGFDGTPTATTDAAGAFEVAGTWRKGAELVLWKEGWTTTSGDRDPAPPPAAEQRAGGPRRASGSVAAPGQAPEREHTLTMARCVEVRGRVLFPDGEPVPGAVVALHPATSVNGPRDGATVAGGRPLRALTDAHGCFRLDGAATDGRQVVHAAAEGHLPACSAPLVGPDDADLTDVEIRLRPGAVVEVLVTGPDGAPLEGAAVAWSLRADPQQPRREPDWESATARTDVDGTCRLSNLNVGELSVSIAHPRYVSVDCGSFRTAEGETVRVVKALWRGGAIVGVVLGTDGAPRPGAMVHMESATRDFKGDRRTDRLGGFEFIGLHDGAYHLVARAEHAAVSEAVSATADGPAATLRLRPERPISGTVCFADGSPAAGARITARAVASHETRDLRVTTSVADDGTFRINGLLPGSYDLAVGQDPSPAAPSANLLPVTVDGVAAGTADFAIRVVRGATISGRVFLAGGAPAPGGYVEAAVVDAGGAGTAPRGRTVTVLLRDGAFRLAGLPAGLARVTVSVGAQRVTTDLRSGAEDVRIDLPETGTIRGRVLLPNGTPAAGASVRVPGPAATPYAATDAGGRFSLRGVSVGTYSVEARLQVERVLHTAGRDSVVVVADETTDVPDLVLESQGR